MKLLTMWNREETRKGDKRETFAELFEARENYRKEQNNAN